MNRILFIICVFLWNHWCFRDDTARTFRLFFTIDFGKLQSAFGGCRQQSVLHFWEHHSMGLFFSRSSGDRSFAKSACYFYFGFDLWFDSTFQSVEFCFKKISSNHHSSHHRVYRGYSAHCLALESSNPAVGCHGKSDYQ